MPEAIKTAEQAAANRDAGMADLFADVAPADEQGDAYAEFRQVRAQTPKEKLGGEKDTLGLYVTGHPIDEYEQELRHFVRNRIHDLKADSQPQTIAGLVVSMRTMKTRRGGNMAIITLDDRTARIEVTLFSEVWEACREKLAKDAIVVVEGTVSFDDYNGMLKVSGKAVRSLLEAREGNIRCLKLSLQESDFGENFSSRFKQLLEPARTGQCPLVVDYQRSGARGQLLLGDNWRVEPSDELVQRLRDHFGGDRVKLSYGEQGQ
jgi:DNA polymerase-3 subunit alpha